MDGPLSAPLVSGRRMIRGRVAAGQRALVDITLLGSQGQTLSLTTILDTGFEGYITLPPEAINALGLAPLTPSTYELANGQSVQFNTYLATVSWHGRPRLVLALEANGVPLLGTSLLWGSRVTLEMQEGGPVIIDELSP